jgi:uncharacterized protein (TIGR02147 family)
LLNELNKRKLQNPKYSLRAFARDLKISSGRLCDILKGRRGLGPQVAQRIVEALQLPAAEKEEFELLLEKQIQYFSNLGKPVYSLSQDEFNALVDWEYFATLSLLETRSANSTAAWVADRLGVTAERAGEVLARLERMKMIVLKKNKYYLTHKSVVTTTDITSSALKESHRQNIQQAMTSLYEDPVDMREISNICMAVDASLIPQAKQMIRDFHRKMSRFLEQGEKNEVYLLNVQLFPVSKTRSANTLQS